MTVLADRLAQAARAAQREVMLVAPFIKVDALAAILNAVPVATARVTVIARWIPAEIAAGVCDIEIFDLIQARKGAVLYVHPLLHAKLYRFDGEVLMGSANLTRKALGLAAPANLELLLRPDVSLDEILAFESKLLRAALRVDVAYSDWMAAQVATFLSQAPAAAEALRMENHELAATWLPTCPSPERLWNVYASLEQWRLVESAVEAAREDLAAMGIPMGLIRDCFDRHVAAVLDRMPLVGEIDEAARAGISTEAAAALIARAGGTLPFPAAEMWEVLRAWMMHFQPDRYRREASAEVFRHGRILG